MEFPAAKKLSLFRLLLIEAASDWAESPSPADSSDFERLQIAFETRFRLPRILQHIAAKQIFTRRQRDDESVEDYIVAMRKLARSIDADNNITSYAILNGLGPHSATYVTQQQPADIQQLLEYAGIAESTTSPCTNVHDRLADAQLELKRLFAKLDKFTTATVSNSRSQSPVNDGLVLMFTRSF